MTRSGRRVISLVSLNLAFSVAVAVLAAPAVQGNTVGSPTQTPISSIATAQAPTPDVAMTSDSTVSVTWNSQTDPVNLYMNGQLLNSTPMQGYSYTVDNLIPGNTYTFVLTTVVGQTESAPSPSVTITMLASPTGVTAVPSDRQVQLTWNPVAGAVGYDVYSNDSNGNPVNTSLITGTSYTALNLTNGETMDYTVRAVDSGGHLSIPSTTVSAAPFTTQPPSVPANLRVINGDHSATLYWDPSDKHGQLGQITYTVFENGVKATDVLDTQYTFTNLKDGTTYSFSVSARNSLGYRSAMSPSVVDEEVQLPANVQASVAPNAITLSWDAPTEKDIVGFNIFNITPGESGQVNTTLVKQDHYTIPNLKTDMNYFFAVQAVTASGGTSGDAYAGGLTQPSIPKTPAQFTAYADKFGQVHLSWASADASGAFQVYKDGQAIGPVLSKTSYITPPLASGNYTFYVTASNAAGESKPSRELYLHVTNQVPASAHQFHTTIVLNGKSMLSPYAFVYGGTTYMPIYYVHDLLSNLGIQSSWDGSHNPQVWTIQDSVTPPSSFHVHALNGTVNVFVNGIQVEDNVPRVAAADPNSHVVNTYLPIWYVQTLLRALGIQNTWDGRPGVKTWALTN